MSASVHTTLGTYDAQVFGLINGNRISRGKTDSVTTGKDLSSLRLLGKFIEDVTGTCLPTTVKGKPCSVMWVRLFL